MFKQEHTPQRMESVEEQPRSRVREDAVAAGRGAGAINPYISYTVLVILPVLVFIALLFHGKNLPHTVGAASPETANTAAGFDLGILLKQTALIIAVARIFGLIIRRFGQPQVIGEMIAGVVLGPSLFGWLWPSAYQWVFPAGIARINSLSQIGVILFIFLVGVELDLKDVRARFRQILVVSHAGMALPILGGGILAFFLYHDYAPANHSFVEFTLFFACAMSVTAFPVLARILDEKKLTATPLGAAALTCASVADVTAWIMLAVAVAMEQGIGRVQLILWQTIIGAAIYLAVMFFLVRPALARFWQRAAANGKMLSYNEFSILILVILFSALSTELLRVHAIFGAFIAGVIMPRDERLQSAVRSRLEIILVVLLLPLFFAATGLRTDVGLLSSSRDWYFAFWIIAVAIAGKLGGSAIAARASGIGWREAGALGVLMNSRGLMELVLLTIGLQDGIITPALFTIMVFMTIVTTMMTVPLLAWFMPSPTKTTLATREEISGT
ncbi:MAG TPA: cation:proton antiporter [Verrucomicrobiae bacterium]